MQSTQDTQKLKLYDEAELAEMKRQDMFRQYRNWFATGSTFPTLHRCKVLEGEDIGDNSAWSGALIKAQQYLAANPSAILALLGPRGTGKTQMATRLAYDSGMVRQANGRRAGVMYRRVAELFMEFKEAYGQRSTFSELDLMASFAVPPLLVLDEMQVRGATDWEDTMLALLVDRRYCEGVQTIMISNLKPKDFAESVGDSIMDRIAECGAVIRCDWASFRGKPGARGGAAP